MAQFPVHDLIDDVEFNLVVVIQSDFFDFIDTRVVIPVREHQSARLDELINPALDWRGRSLTLLTERIATIPKARLGRQRGDFKTHSLEISRAIDRLMTGF
ncbi:MAG: CcdB family protein [Pseudomonadota bacterium]